MGDKTIKTRIQLKYDTEENWNKSVLEADGGTKTTTGSSFIPKKGEVILYSTDGTHPFSRLKVGDGITNVVQLPFLGIRFQDIGDKDNIKTKQTAVTDPNVAAGATSNSFINTISQDANGEITVTKANLAVASTSSAGIVQLSSAINSTDTDKAATPSAVKDAYDLANGAIPKNIGLNTGDLIYYDSSKDAKYSKLSIGANNSILKVVSGALSWSALTKGDLGLDNVENTALSTWTGSSNITTVGTISSGTWNGDAIAANKIDELSTAKLTSGILGVSRGGTGLDNIAADQVLIGGANNSITQRAITSPTSNETFTQYLAQNPTPDNNLIVNLKTLKLAIPPINLSNPISITGSGYQLSYYAPTSKGTLHSVLIAQGTSTNSQGTEPLWLDPTSLSGVDNTGSGGTLFYGRDSLSNESVKPFKTQWGTLPVEQGGTGCTTFATGQLLVGNGTDNLTTVVKTYENVANTVVVRDSSGDFCTRQITLHFGGYGLISDYNNENLPSTVVNERKKIIIIDNNGIPTHYGNLEANNLTATIGIINMSCTNAYSDNETPMINWYKKITVQGNSTEYKIGEINWDITNNTGILKNYYYNNNNVYYEAYKLPNLPVDLSTNKTYTLLSTNDSQLLTQFLENSVLYTAGGFNKVTSIRSNNGALYASSQGGNLQWGTLPVAQGGTGLTNSRTVNAVIIGNSSSISGAFQTVPTGNGAFYATAEDYLPQFGTLPIAQGGTGATTLFAAKANLGFGVAAHDFTLSNFLELDQHWGIGAVVQSAEVVEGEDDKDFLDKKTFLILTNSGLLSYNNTDDEKIWEFNINSSDITATVYNTPNETDPGVSKASYKILYKSNDANAVGSSTSPVYIDENGEATACGSIDIAHGGTSANNYNDARTNLRACRWILSTTDVLDQVKTSASLADQAIFFSVDGSSYAGAPTNTNWYDIMAISPTSVGNATTLLAHEYGSNYNLYIGYTWRNGTSQPTWKKLLWTHETDMPQNAANFNTIATANTTTFYRNGFIIPSPATINDGGFLRVRGTAETDTVLELGTWDDSGSGETIQFNYYPTTSQITPTYSVSVPKASGTLCLTGASVSGSTHAGALQTYFNSYKASEPRNVLTAHYSSAYGNGSVCMGYFLNGYDSNPYGGFFVCHYNWPRYVGINNGTYTEHNLISDQNYTSYTVTKTGSGASGTWGINVTGNAATATRINGNLGAISSATNCNIWVSSTGSADGIPKYVSGVYVAANTGTIYAKTFEATDNTFPAFRTTRTDSGEASIYWKNATAGWAAGINCWSVGAGVFAIGQYAGTGSSAWRFKIDNNGYCYAASRMYNAVWNDYAEYRKVNDKTPGYAVNPFGNLTTQRLEAGARIVSDTYGHSIGYMENDETLEPVALAGRVLAYPLYDKSYYEIGDAVCATEGGKIDKMTREEIMMYPDRILGIVNEIPDYDIWKPSLTGSREPVHTNGRIWIDVK